jgi:DNA-binding transcriptional MerR regulator
MKNKIFYTINEVAEMLDLPASTLRYWEKEFSVLRPHRTTSGIRKYVEKDIEFLKKILYFTRDCGYSLEGVKKVFKTSSQQYLDPKYELILTLNEMKATLLDMKSQLEKQN